MPRRWGEPPGLIRFWGRENRLLPLREKAGRVACKRSGSELRKKFPPPPEKLESACQAGYIKDSPE